jgi:Holliday junction resolvasome RuvABC endonuclease subunit
MDLISIGCDLGLVKSGIVILNDRFEIESQNLIKVRSRGAERLCDIERAFDAIVQPYRPCDINVFVEGYAYGARYQRESLAELGGVMRRYLHLANLQFWIIPPTSLKLFVTGTGKASKNYMKKCTKDQWGKVFKSDDVCDAHGLSRLGMCVMKATEGAELLDLPPHARDVVKDVLLNQEYYRNSNTARKRKIVKNG